jgi:hypothetical protein
MATKPSALAECLDDAEVAILVATYGAGQRIYVPSSTAQANHFEILLGLAATSSLISALGGTYAYLPGLPRPTGHAREPSLALVEALSRKMSAAQIARKYRCSVRVIYSKRTEIKRRKRLGLPLDARVRPRKQETPQKARARSKPARPSQKRIMMDAEQ